MEAGKYQLEDDIRKKKVEQLKVSFFEVDTFSSSF